MAIKSEIIPLRVSPLLKDKIERAAGDAQENTAEYIRKAVEQRLERETKKSE